MWPLARASLILSKIKADNDDQRFGIEIIRKAIQTPLRQIAENAGEDGAVISGKLAGKRYNFGFDAQTGEFKDLVKAGIIDPTKVVRTALQDAASVSGLLITTEAMVAERRRRSGADAWAVAAWVAWAAWTGWISKPFALVPMLRRGRAAGSAPFCCGVPVIRTPEHWLTPARRSSPPAMTPGLLGPPRL